MPHAEASSLGSGVSSKSELYQLMQEHLESLLEEDSHWVSALSNASAVIYNMLNDYLPGRPVNWAGFYLASELLGKGEKRLLLGPFQGKSACLYCRLDAVRPGVCATAFLSGTSVRHANVHAVPGHIACDDATNSELVIPLGKYGVLDLDSTALNGFDEEDEGGLNHIVEEVLLRRIKFD